MNQNNNNNKKGIYLHSIDQEVWQEFKNMTKLKHGKLHGALSQEVEKALTSYMNIHTHDNNIKTQKPIQIKKKELNFIKIAKELLNFNSIYHKNLIAIILKIGISDHRTIKSYIENFIVMEWIQKSSKMSLYAGISYLIDHDMIYITLTRYEDQYNISLDF